MNRSWFLLLYGVLVLTVPGYPSGYSFFIDTIASITGVLASHFFRGYFNSLPTSKHNIISYCLGMLSYIAEYECCRSYFLSIFFNFFPDMAVSLLSDYPWVISTFAGYRPVTLILLWIVLFLVSSRLLLFAYPGKNIPLSKEKSF